MTGRTVCKRNRLWHCESPSAITHFKRMMSELRGFHIRLIVLHLKYGTGFGAYDFTLYHAYTIVAYPGASAVSNVRKIVRVSRTQLKWYGIRWRTAGKVKGKQALVLCLFALTPLVNFYHFFNFRAAIFDLTSCGWVLSFLLTPYFLWEYIWFTTFLFTTTYSGTQKGRKTSSVCITDF